MSFTMIDKLTRESSNSNFTNQLTYKTRKSSKNIIYSKSRRGASQVSLVSSGKHIHSPTAFASFSVASAHDAFQQLQLSSGRPRSGLPYYILNKIRGKRIYKEKIDHRLAEKLRSAGTHTRRCRGVKQFLHRVIYSK